MLTNAEAVVFRIVDEEYAVTFTGSVMWQEVSAYSVKSGTYSANHYSERNEEGIQIFIPDITADVKKGDFIIMGTVPENLSEAAKTAHTVQSAAYRNFGSSSMQHIEVKAV